MPGRRPGVRAPRRRTSVVTKTVARALKRGACWLAAGGGLLIALAHAGPAALAPVSDPILALPGSALLFLALQAAPGGRGSFYVGWIAGGVHFAVALHWMAYPFLVRAESHLWALPFAAVLVPAGFGLFWAAACWLARRIARDGVALAFALATALAAAEWLRGNLLTGFPWAMPGQVWIGTEAQILYPAFGANAATFLTLLVAALAVAGIRGRPRDVRAFVRVGGRLALSFLVAALALGAAHGLVGSVAAPSVEAPDRPVLQLVQPNIPQREKWAANYRSRNLERLLSLSGPVGGARVDVVIWPESAFPGILDREELRTDTHGISEMLAERAGRGTAFLLGALTRGGEEEYYNSLVALGGTEGTVEFYDKHHLVPFGEYLPLAGLLTAIGFDPLTVGGFSSGPGPRKMEAQGIPAFAAAICYEAIFSGEMRRAAEGASWILQLTNDAWFGPDAGPRQHLALARIRAAEFGLPLVRVANTGITAVLDASGRPVDSIPLGEEGALVAGLPGTRTEPTPFMRWGEWGFGILLGIGLAASLALRMVRHTASS